MQCQLRAAEKIEPRAELALRAACALGYGVQFAAFAREKMNDTIRFAERAQP